MLRDTVLLWVAMCAITAAFAEADALYMYAYNEGYSRAYMFGCEGVWSSHIMPRSAVLPRGYMEGQEAALADCKDQLDEMLAQ